MPPEMITNVVPTAMIAKNLASVAVCTSAFELRKLFTSTPVRRSTWVPANRVRIVPRSRMTMSRPAAGEVSARCTKDFIDPSACCPPGPPLAPGRARPVRSGGGARALPRQLVADHELPHRGRPQEGREIGGVQPPVGMAGPVGGLAVPRHGV